MGTAQMHGSLWGARARDYAEFAEGLFRPVYERVFDEAGVEPGTRLLDVGCGPGLAAHLAAQRGALVAGLDAAEASLAIARERTPKGDFRSGDMEDLPWPGQSFDVVTGFNSFQFAGDRVAALREARRVARSGGRVAMVVWGHDEDCETTVTVAAVGKYLPPAPSPSPAAPAPTPLSVPGAIEELMTRARLAPLTGGAVECPFEFPDLETALRGLLSAGVMVAAARRAGQERVRQVVAESLAPFRTSDGSYRQRNVFRFVIASA